MNNINTLPLNFKHKQMCKEFYQLSDRIKAVILFTNNYVYEKYGYMIFWTEFYRTQEQQNFYYKEKINDGFFVLINGVKYYSKDLINVTKSVHQYNRGADMSIKCISLNNDYGTKVLNDEEVLNILNIVNNTFEYGKNGIDTCIYHKVYGQKHLHFQTKI